MVLPIIAAAVTATSALVDGIQGARAAKAQHAANVERARQNKRAVLQSLGETTFDIRRRQIEERAQVGQEIENLTRRAVLHRGAGAASAGSANVAGSSVSEQQMDNLTQEARAKGNLKLLQEFRETAAERQIRAARIQAMNRIAAVQPPPFVRPSGLSIGLNSITAGISGFAAGASIQDALDARRATEFTGTSLPRESALGSPSPSHSVLAPFPDF